MTLQPERAIARDVDEIPRRQREHVEVLQQLSRGGAAEESLVQEGDAGNRHRLVAAPVAADSRGATLAGIAADRGATLAGIAADRSATLAGVAADRSATLAGVAAAAAAARASSRCFRTSASVTSPSP